MERTKNFDGNIFAIVALGLAGVLLLPGCVPGQEGGASSMAEKRTLNSARHSPGDGGVNFATEPIARQGAAGDVGKIEGGGEVGARIGSVEIVKVERGGAAGGPFGLSAEDDARILRCVDEAFDLLMAGDAAGAVETLTDAQTMRYWAQSRRAPSVLYWLGQAHERLNERTAARAAYRKVLRLYPDSVWSKRARKRLTALIAGGVEED